MKEFMENWKTDPKFKTKVQLIAYTLFVVCVAIFALSTRSDISISNEVYTTNENKSEYKIKMSDEYTIKIKLNEEDYKYVYSYADEIKTITKTAKDETIKYVLKDENYYRGYVSVNTMTSETEVYDIINYSYLNVETINKYLEVATKEDNKYLVNIKDIILGSDSKEYITITIEDNKINIDYTSLLKIFDKEIQNSLVEIIIEN